MKSRIKAFELLDLAHREFTKSGPTAKFHSLGNQLLDFLSTNFPPVSSPNEEKLLEEIGRLMYGQIRRGPNKTCKHTRGHEYVGGAVDTSSYSDERWVSCYNATFAVLVIRRAIKHLGLPITQCARWRNFSVIYLGLLFAA